MAHLAHTRVSSHRTDDGSRVGHLALRIILRQVSEPHAVMRPHPHQSGENMRVFVQGYEGIQNMTFLLRGGTINVLVGDWCTCKDDLFMDIQDRVGLTPYDQHWSMGNTAISVIPDSVLDHSPSFTGTWANEFWPVSIQDGLNALRAKSRNRELDTLQNIFDSIGSASKDDVLWFDRPERSTPAVALKLLAEMLHYAARRGIQVNLNTDCGILVEHISLLTEYRAKGTPIRTMFTNFYLDDAGVTKVEQQPNRIDLTTTVEILQASRQLYDTELKLTCGYDGWGDRNSNGDKTP